MCLLVILLLQLYTTATGGVCVKTTNVTDKSSRDFQYTSNFILKKSKKYIKKLYEGVNK
jgi:hypothetical protein